MRQIDLTEYQQDGPYTLTSEQRDALQKIPSLTVTRADTDNVEAEYYLAPGSTVGAIELADLSILIHPKIGITNLLSMACYAVGAYKSQEQRLFDFKEEETLPDTLALALSAAARRAFSRGLLHNYLTREEALYTVRGRIRFDQQIQRRFGIPVPVEVRYDEFTDDTLANRLVKAAAQRLGGMRLRSQPARVGLGWIGAMLDNISPVEFAPTDIPEIRFDQLNEHYRGVVELSRLILRHSAFESGRGHVRATGFLMDMNVVFQEFVTVALREALRLAAGAFRERAINSLDRGGQVHLRPDLVWQEDSACVFVGDAKYKRVREDRVPNADIYQLLAYLSALDLPGGMLIYAKDEDETEAVMHEVRHSGKRLQVVALDLSCALEEILDQVREVADRIRGLRRSRGTSIHFQNGMPVFRVPPNGSPITSEDVYRSLDEWP